MERLRATVGDDRTNGIVRAIGIAAMKAAPGGLPISLDSVVSNTFSRLTQADIAGLVRGDTGVINRVQAMAEEQVKAARAAEPPQNIHAAPGKADGASSHGLGGLAGGKLPLLQGGERARSEAGSGNGSTTPGTSSNAYGRMANIADPAFAKSLGVSSGAVAELSRMGFKKPEEIKALVNDAGSLGIDKSNGAVHLGELKKANPSAYHGHVQFFGNDYQKHWNEIHDLERDAQQETDPIKKAEKLKAVEQAKQQRDQHYQQHMSGAKPAERAAADKVKRDFDLKEGQKNRLQLNKGSRADADEAPGADTSKQALSQIGNPTLSRMEAAAQANGAASAARSAAARASDDRQALLDDDGGAAPLPPQSAKADGPGTAVKPAIVVRTAAKDAPTTPDAAGAKAGIWKPNAVKGEQGQAVAKSEPPKPAAEPVRKVAGTAPSVC